MKRSIKIFSTLFLVNFVTMAVPFLANAQTLEEGAGDSISTSIKYLAAALSVGICAIATSIAQSRIGAAGMGSIVEKPETTGTVIICLAIPETLVILGFVVAAMIIIL